MNGMIVEIEACTSLLARVGGSIAVVEMSVYELYKVEQRGTATTKHETAIRIRLCQPRIRRTTRLCGRDQAVRAESGSASCIGLCELNQDVQGESGCATCLGDLQEVRTADCHATRQVSHDYSACSSARGTAPTTLSQIRQFGRISKHLEFNNF